jgi:capsular exopolysaccharide synthesis family protein
LIKDREQSPLAEAFRALVSCIQQEQAGSDLRSLLFTGAMEGEGTALVALNTAISLAYSGKKVVLVDCDLRKPILHEVLCVYDTGMTDIITRGLPWAKALQESGIENLKFIAGGQVLPRPIESLADPRVQETLAGLREIADYVVVNSSPILFKDNHVWSDACVLAAKVDGVILVLDSRRVRAADARKALELLNGAKAAIIGTVLNDVKRDADLAYHIVSGT